MDELTKAVLSAYGPIAAIAVILAPVVWKELRSGPRNVQQPGAADLAAGQRQLFEMQRVALDEAVEEVDRLRQRAERAEAEVAWERRSGLWWRDTAIWWWMKARDLRHRANNAKTIALATLRPGFIERAREEIEALKVIEELPSLESVVPRPERRRSDRLDSERDGRRAPPAD
jgi:hypothetical protein